MASNAGQVSRNQFLCAICLDTFTQPVSTPCGHNFCLSCLSSYWDTNPVCQCPVCKEKFKKRPNLKVNTFISELMSQLTFEQVEEAVAPVQGEEGAGVAVQCDICTDVRQLAVKSCLECQTSYCSQHLEPHRRAAGLKRHTLINPVSDLLARMCKLHNCKLELFCLDDKEMLCDFCTSLGHFNHNVVPLQEAHQEMKNLLGSTEKQVQLMIQDLLTRVQAEENVITSSEQELTAMVCEVQKSQAVLVSLMKERQQAAVKDTRLSIGNLRKRLEGLQRAQLKLREMKQTEDQISFLQGCRVLPCLPQDTTGNMDARHFPKSLGSCMPQLKTLLHNQTQEVMSLLRVDPLNELRQYEVSITLDPDTAHCQLILSSDGKQVRFSPHRPRKSSVLRPNAFTSKLAVLGRRGFSSGKFYFEVFVGKKTEWCLGVAGASVQKNHSLPRSAGRGIWALWFIVDRFESWSTPGVTVSRGRAEKIGVFVDYDKGEMLFYDVETPRLIHSCADCSFAEEIRPYFNPCNDEHGSNLDPMIIVPVQSRER